jgi:predicted MFS family arabinose efflux permease
MNMPAWQAIMPDLVPRKDLPAAIALNSMTFNLARSIGPALGGIVVATMGPAYVFLINALSFIGVLAVIYFWKEAPRNIDSPPEQFLGAIRAGLRYLFNSSSLPRILSRSFLFIISAGALWALLPVVVRKELNWDSTGFGLLLGSLGFGALIGASVMPFLRNRCGVNFLLIAASLIFSFGTMALAHFRSPMALMPALLFSGAAWTITMSNFNVAVQTTSPSWVRARALSFYTLVFQGGLALSGVMWGIISDYVNVTVALSAAATLLLLTLIPGIKRPIEQGSELDLSPSINRPVKLDPN